MRVVFSLLFAFPVCAFALGVLNIAQSCAADRAMITLAIQSAKDRARVAATKLKELPGQHPDINALAMDLFKPNSESDGWKNAADRLDMISKVQFANADPSSPLWDDFTKGIVGDMIVYCDYRRFTDTFGSGPLRGDPINQVVMQTADWNLYVIQQPMAATTWQPRHRVRKEIYTVSGIDITPRNLNNLRAGRAPGGADPSWYGDADQDIQEANRIKRQFLANGFRRPWIDVFAKRLDATMLHEFSHTFACNLSLDTLGRSSYGWHNARSMQSSQNADNLSIFAVAVKLITLGFIVTKEGHWHLPSEPVPFEGEEHYLDGV